MSSSINFVTLKSNRLTTCDGGGGGEEVGGEEVGEVNQYKYVIFITQLGHKLFINTSPFLPNKKKLFRAESMLCA